MVFCNDWKLYEERKGIMKKCMIVSSLVSQIFIWLVLSPRGLFVSMGAPLIVIL